MIGDTGDLNTCDREGCNQDRGWNIPLMYCSAECERLQRSLAIMRFDARFEAGEDPSEVRVEDIADLRQRAKRWTPETMQERIDELREG